MRKPSEPLDRIRRRRKRPPTAAAVIEFLEYLAPPSLAVPEEPYGVQVGTSAAEVRAIVVAPMASFNALSAAAARKHALLITAAPLLTSPFTSLRLDDPIGGKVAYLVKHSITLYALPNTYAAAPGGFDDTLAEQLGLAATTPLKPTTFEPQYKIAFYVPEDHAERVFAAAAEAGAGRIGAYTHCSFQTRGVGTFLPQLGAKPAVGAVGRLERVEELRIEMIVPQRELQGVIAAILDAHPYEEVAYDVYMVKNPGAFYGRGRLGELPLKVALDTVLAQIQDVLGSPAVRCSHKPEFPISSLAVASGVTQGLFWQAARAGAGAFITGGASLQDMILADNSPTVLIDIGYPSSVMPGLKRLCTQLEKTFGSDGVEITYVQ
ncbi:MAG: Nif3-like dinuclear metal center hexameric protein [Chthonomonadales bacterium]